VILPFSSGKQQNQYFLLKQHINDIDFLLCRGLYNWLNHRLLAPKKLRVARYVIEQSLSNFSKCADLGENWEKHDCRSQNCSQLMWLSTVLTKKLIKTIPSTDVHKQTPSAPQTDIVICLTMLCFVTNSGQQTVLANRLFWV